MSLGRYVAIGGWVQRVASRLEPYRGIRVSKYPKRKSLNGNDPLSLSRCWRPQDFVSRSRPKRRSNIAVVARVSNGGAHVPRFNSTSSRHLSPRPPPPPGLWTRG